MATFIKIAILLKYWSHDCDGRRRKRGSFMSMRMFHLHVHMFTKYVSCCWYTNWLMLILWRNHNPQIKKGWTAFDKLFWKQSPWLEITEYRTKVFAASSWGWSWFSVAPTGGFLCTSVDPKTHDSEPSIIHTEQTICFQFSWLGLGVILCGWDRKQEPCSVTLVSPHTVFATLACLCFALFCVERVRIKAGIHRAQ